MGDIPFPLLKPMRETGLTVLGAIPVFQIYCKMDLEAMIPERARNFIRNMGIARDRAREHQGNFVDQHAVFERVNPLIHRYKLMLNPMQTHEEGNLLMGVEQLRHFAVDPHVIWHGERLLPAIRLRKLLD